MVNISRIDIFLISDEAKVVIAIENKVYAKERKGGCDGGQLNKYRKIIKEKYPDYTDFCIYLTRKGEKPTDKDNWATANYTSLVSLLEAALERNKAVNQDAKMILLHYIAMIKRNLIDDTEMKKRSQKIYEKFKDAISLILMRDHIKDEEFRGRLNKLFIKYKWIIETIQSNVSNSSATI